MLSRDSSGLRPDSATAQRWRLLRDSGAELKIVVASRETGSWKEDGLDVVGTGGGNLFLRIWRMNSLAAQSSGECDFITAQDPFELGLVAWAVSKKAKKGFEVQDHGGFFDGEPADEPLWFLRSRLAWHLAKRAKRIRTVSPKSLENLKSEGMADKVYWLPIAADRRFASLERRPEVGLVVSVGRLVSVKRFGLLLRSLLELRKTVPEARLAIVGDGPLLQDLQGQARSLDLGAAVEFAGQADPAPWLARAAVFALLSSHEGWGIAAVEAALAGVPVVMADTGCARWLEQEAGATVIGRGEEDPSTIARRLAAARRQEAGRLAPDRLPDAGQAAAEQVAEWRKSC